MIKKAQQSSRFSKVLPYILVVGGFLGLIAAFILTMEKMSLLQNAAYEPSCNLNPVLSCGSVIGTPQASAFNFPNPFIGLAGYAVVITVGMALLAGAQLKRWFWLGLQAGTIFGLGFVHWLAYQSIYKIGALCIYCLLVWTVTLPIFWYTTLYNLEIGNIKAPKRLESFVKFITGHHLDILIVWYMAFIAAILTHFWYYWKTII